MSDIRTRGHSKKTKATRSEQGKLSGISTKAPDRYIVPGHGVRADGGASQPLGEEDEPPAVNIRDGYDKVPDPSMSKTSAEPTQRAAKVPTQDNYTQGCINPADWSNCGVRHVMGRLRSDKEPVRLRALRLLRLRWWHCSAANMRRNLKKAGLPEHVLSMAERVCKEFAICSKWAPAWPKH